jgi:hypothetical protein
MTKELPSEAESDVTPGAVIAALEEDWFPIFMHLRSQDQIKLAGSEMKVS